MAQNLQGVHLLAHSLRISSVRGMNYDNQSALCTCVNIPEFTCVLDQGGRAPVSNGEYYRTDSKYIEKELTSRRQEGIRWFNRNQSF